MMNLVAFMHSFDDLAAPGLVGSSSRERKILAYIVGAEVSFL
jgi:hypothetical protein